MSVDLYNKVSYKCSKIVANDYSTSFSLGTRMLHKSFRSHIYAIYGFVRFADEIVDTFHEHNKKMLLERFITDTHNSIKDKISLNPILNSFQLTVNKFNIDMELIDTFLRSMEMDLSNKSYDKEGYETYILGSAEVVGLMCLKIFVDGDEQKYLHLKSDAMKLGAAFQKINFLRDLKADVKNLGRAYFPEFDMNNFNAETKIKIENEIQEDFNAGLRGIKQLPKKSRLGVYLAYVYYYSLFKKIKRTQPEKVISTRIRVSDTSKYFLLLASYFKHNLNLIR